MEVDDVIIEEHDVMGLDALDNLNSMNTVEQDSGSEVSDEDSWDIDPITRSEAILRAAASGSARDGQINTLSESGLSSNAVFFSS